MFEDIIYPNALCGVIIGQDLWFMNHVANALMRMRLSDGKVEEWHQIEPYGISESTLFIDMILFGNTLVLIPDVCGHHIVFFDIKTKKQMSIDIPKEWFVNRNICIENKIYLFSKFPQREFRVACLDVNKKNIYIVDGLEKQLERIIPQEIDRDKQICSVTFDGIQGWILIKNTNCIIRLDLEEMMCSRYDIDTKEFGQITSGNKGIYLSDAGEKCIYLWDKKNNFLEKIDFARSNDDDIEDVYISLSFHDNTMICLTRYGEIVDLYDEMTKDHYEISLKSYNNEFPLEERCNYNFYNFRVVSSDKYIVILPCAGKEFLVIDKESDRKYGIVPKGISDFKKRLLSEKYKKIFFNENNDLKLNDFIRVLA